MNIESGQTWSIPPHGPDIHVRSVEPQELAEPLVSYSVGGKAGAPYEKALSVFQTALTRLSARMISGS